MANKFAGFFSAFLLSLYIINVLGTKDESTYIIIAPEKIRPGQPLDIYFFSRSKMREESASASVTFSLEGTSYQGRDVKKTVLLSKKFDMHVMSPNIYSLDIPFDIDRSFRYDLKLKAEGEIRSMTGSVTRFSNTSRITLDEKSMSLFIQTDKSMYKPGQKVNYRVISTYPDLLPFDQLFNVEIFDPRNNKIIQKHNATQTFKGVVSDSLQLTNQPVEGKWKIVAQFGTEKVEKVFIVEEYVLPKFEVKVKAPSYVIYNRTNTGNEITGEYRFTVEAIYTHGKPVEGPVEVDVTMNTTSYGRVKYKFRTISKRAILDKVTRRAEFVLKGSDILSLENNQFSKKQWLWSGAKIVYSAKVTEEISQVTLEGSAITKLERESFKTEFLSTSPENYKNGLEYTGFWKVTQIDGSPVTEEQLKNEKGEDEMMTLEISYIWMYNKTYRGSTYPERGTPQKRIKKFPVSSSGMVLFQFIPPLNNKVNDMWFDEISLTAFFKGKRSYKNLQRFETKKTKLGIQLSVVNEKAIKADEELKIRLTSTETIGELKYFLLSRGRIVRFGYLDMDGTKEKQFEIGELGQICRKLAPTGRIFVFTMTRPEEEVVADSVDFNVDCLFSNKVSVSFNKETVSPGEPVDLKIEASPMSYVGLMAVDTSVLLLGTGHDITTGTVMDEVKKYDSSNKFFPYRPMFRRKRSIMPFWPIRWGAQDTAAVFSNAGLIVMTNSIINKKIIHHYPEYMPDAPGMPGVRGPNAPAGAPGPPGRPGGDDKKGQQDANDNDQTEPNVRKNFPETWLHSDLEIGPSGQMTLNIQAPDTITSWVASAIAMNEQDGFGVANSVAKTTVFKPFFIQLSLPYSVIRHEEFKLKVLVFNYMSSTQVVRVSLKIPPKSFVARTGRNLEEEISNVWATKSVTVAPNSAENVHFWIEPKELGSVPLYVVAKAPLAADALERNLLVEPEGSPEQYSKSTFLRLSKSEQGKSVSNLHFDVALPPESILVEGSQYITVTALGDIMGKSMNSLESLIRMPYGCGEQNMINFVPNIVAMDYMTASGQVTDSIKKKAIKYMTAGYQRELTYQRTDGSFSAFGNRDKSGSLWLTAYVVKSFVGASKYIFVDQKILENSLTFILNQQDKDGSFHEPKGGRVIHAGMQGGTSKGVTLTAYVIISLIEGGKYTAKTRALITAIDNGLRYLEEESDKYSKDPYVLAILSYTFQLAKIHHKSYNLKKDQAVWNNLMSLAKEEEGMKWWDIVKKEIKCPRKWCSSYNTAKASEVELVAYILLSFSSMEKYKNDIDATLPVLRWILAQTNEKGAFKSTQDTVVGLLALAKYSSMVLAGNEKMINIRLDYNGTSQTFKPIAHNNATILQQAVVPKDVKQINVRASGYGTAIVQMNVNFNVKDAEGEPPKLKSTLEQFHSPKGVQLTSCLIYKSDKGEESGMIVTELNVLSGHFIDTSELLQTYGTKGLKRVENLGKKVNLYWDGFSEEKECFDLYVQRRDPVVNVQPAEIVHYIYYDVEERSSHMYSSDKKGFVLNLVEARLAACSDCGVEYVSELKSSSDLNPVLPMLPSIASSIKCSFALAIFILAALFLL